MHRYFVHNEALIWNSALTETVSVPDRTAPCEGQHKHGAHPNIKNSNSKINFQPKSEDRIVDVDTAVQQIDYVCMRRFPRYISNPCVEKGYNARLSSC